MALNCTVLFNSWHISSVMRKTVVYSFSAYNLWTSFQRFLDFTVSLIPLQFPNSWCRFQIFMVLGLFRLITVGISNVSFWPILLVWLVYYLKVALNGKEATFSFCKIGTSYFVFIYFQRLVEIVFGMMGSKAFGGWKTFRSSNKMEYEIDQSWLSAAASAVDRVVMKNNHFRRAHLSHISR